MKLKKLVKGIGLMFVVTIMAVLVLYGCSNSKKDSSSSGKEVKLTFAQWDPFQEATMKKIVDKFEEKNPNIKISLETTPWEQYWTKMEAATTAGQMPDIITMHSSEFYRYASSDAIMSLQDMTKDKSIDLDKFTAGFDKLYTYKDKLYAVPKDMTTVCLAYNKEIFEKAGVPVPKNNMTWDEFAQLAQKVTNKAAGIWGYTVPPKEPEVETYPRLFQAGGSVFNEDGTKSTFNNPQNIKALNFEKDLIDKYKVSPSYQALSETKYLSFFEAGKAAMIPCGNWQITTLTENESLKGKLGFVTFPKEKNRATIMNGLGWSASAKTKHPEEVKKFLSFLASEEANKIQAEDGTSIPAYKGLGDAYAKSFKDSGLDIQAYVDSISFGLVRPKSAQGLKFEETMATVFNDFFAGKISAEDTVKDIEDKANQFLGKQ